MTQRNFIYVIEAISGVVKIGVSFRPEIRAATINTHSPIPCRLIAMWPGNSDDERELHLRFREHRQHLEWFRIEGQVLAFVERVRGTGVVVREWHGCQSGYGSRSEGLTARRSAAIKALWSDPEWKAKQLATRAMYRQRRAGIASGAAA